MAGYEYHIKFVKGTHALIRYADIIDYEEIVITGTYEQCAMVLENIEREYVLSRLF